MKKLGDSKVALSIIIGGCEGVVRTDNAGDKKFTDIKSAKLNTSAIGSVEYGDFKNIKISVNSPSIESVENKGRY